ncbi:glycosyltransferase family 2 protein [Campylobacter lanienae]|uniref:glycosyltransferase family 2 protein n=1 Tax=Campylobacter lanienae TaxID=75658 RepID=UPI000BB3F86D|nr:glycosyltransferase [Campylobacter lanienae]
MPKVSVLMPVYKTNEKYLKEAIASILNQTFTDFEFLILDDCPDDTREEIVKSYNDNRIKYSKNEKNLGITPSRNKLIDMAKGEYLAIFDHDDISLPTRFEQQVKYLDEHKDVGVVSCTIKFIDRDELLQYPTNDTDIKLALIGYCALSHSASMIRKSILINNNIRYEEAFSPAEDYALWCRLIPFTNFYNIPEVLFHYRDHAENTSHKQESKMRQATFAIRDFVKNDNPGLYGDFLLKISYINRIKLFGFIPLFKIIKQANRIKIYLFSKVLLFKSKSTIKLHGREI